jgi:hypothetical protein
VKTISLKKVAVVAVASLGFGLLSVVPANAAAAAVDVVFAFSSTSATATPTAGSPVVVPFTFDTQTAHEASAVAGIQATLTTRPTNSALDAEGATTADLTLNVVSTDAATAAATASTTSAGAKIIYTTVGTTVTSPAVGGSFGFTPDVAGYYIMTLKYTADGTASIADGSAVANGQTITTVGINVSGAALVQANSGLGASTGTQIAGRQSAAAFFLPAASTSASRYTVTATGATITSVKTGASLADAVNANTYTANTGVTTIAPTDYSLGARVAGAATTTSVLDLAGTAVTDSFIVQFTSATAGTAVVTLKSENVTTGALTTVSTATVTYGSADLLTISAANSTILKAKSNDAPTTTTDAVAIVQSATIGTQRANIQVTVNNGNATALVDQDVKATISGPGLIAWDADGTGVGTSAGSVTMDMGVNENVEFLVVSGSGVGGVATITFTVGTSVLGTETITFYGDVSKYTATTNIVAAANGTTSTDVVTVCATDSANVVVPGATIYGFSGDATVATMAETSDVTETAAIAASGTSMADHVAATAIGCVGFSITALSQTTKPSVVLTFGDAATIATSTITTTATVLVGSVAATTVALTSDKTTYKPGEAVVLTLTYKDSVGRPVAHGPGTDTLAAALTSSSALGTAALFGTANISKVGTTSQTVYAPLQGGPVTVSGKTGTGSTQTYVVLAANGVALSTTFTVTDANASILTQIDALNAKIVALNALIAKIMKKLGVK